MISEEVVEYLVLEAPPGLYTEVQKYHDSIEVGQTYVVPLHSDSEPRVVLVLELEVIVQHSSGFNPADLPQPPGEVQLYMKCVMGEELVHTLVAFWTWNAIGDVYKSTTDLRKVSDKDD